MAFQSVPEYFSIFLHSHILSNLGFTLITLLESILGLKWHKQSWSRPEYCRLQPEPVVLSPFVQSLHQVGHADKNGQCALVHAALKGHAEIINILLGLDWGAENPTDPQQHHSNDTVSGKVQAVQQAVTAAASLGHIQACISSLTKIFLVFIWNWFFSCRAWWMSVLHIKALLDVDCSLIWVKVCRCFSFLVAQRAILQGAMGVKVCLPAGGEELAGPRWWTAGSAGGCSGLSLGRNRYLSLITQIHFVFLPLSVHSKVMIQAHLKYMLALYRQPAKHGRQGLACFRYSLICFSIRIWGNCDWYSMVKGFFVWLKWRILYITQNILSSPICGIEKAAVIRLSYFYLYHRWDRAACRILLGPFPESISDEACISALGTIRV